MKNFNIVTKAKQLCYRKKRQLCTTWGCKYSNPPQAAAGKYNCLGCTSGTYIVRPENVSGENPYPLIPPPSKHAQRRALERIHAERREEANCVLRAKPLPETPGLAQRAVTPERRLRLAERSTPPKDDGYRPPLRAKHSSASRNLRKRQLIYPVDGYEYDSDAVSNMSCSGSVPAVSVAGSTGSKSSARAGRVNSPRPPLPPLYYPTPPHSMITGPQQPTVQYEVSMDGRVYF